MRRFLVRGQEDIIANTELIHSTADSLGALIEEVAFNLSELDREVQKHFRSIEEEISDFKDDFKAHFWVFDQFGGISIFIRR